MKHAFTIIPLTIEARGEIVANNLPEFRELVREALSNINRDLKTDEEFGQAELDVKALKEAEDSVRAAAIKSFDDQLKALVDGLNETAEEIRLPRLELEKLIATRKEEVKTGLIEAALATYDIDPRDARKHFLSGLQTSIKGKRTLDSMEKSMRVYVTTTQGTISKAREILAQFEAAHGSSLIMDRRELELRQPESLEAELRRRLEAHAAAEEKKRLQAEADKAKAELEANRKAEALRNAPPAQPELPAAPPAGRMETSPFLTPGPQHAAAEAPVKTAHEEWEEAKIAVLAAFGPLKQLKSDLIYSANQAKLQGFGAAVNRAWKEWA